MSFFEELKRRNVFRVGFAYGVTAWLLIQISDTVFPRIGLSESAVTLVIALLALGFLPTLIFAWAFEMTPEGIRRERDIDRAESTMPQTAKKLDRVIMSLLLMVVAWFVFDEYYLEPREQQALPHQQATLDAKNLVPSVDETKPSDTSQKSIAVLPFVNMSPDIDNEYFSDGISEELLNVLVRVSELEVASRTSSFAYKGKDLPLAQIAGELGVANILEGSVRKAGNRVRITAQLIDATSDRHLWSNTYERELDDIFDIQEEISNSIVDALKLALDVGEEDAMARLQRPTNNPEAYELYLQGRFLWRRREEENIRRAIDLLQQAVDLDPNFAKAFEALASAWTVLPAWAITNPTEALEKAVGFANQALMLDPTLAEARAIRAHHMGFERRWLDSLIEFESAMESEPKNAGVRQWYAEALAQAGYLDLAMLEIDKAFRLDPASPVINSTYSMLATVKGEDELAIRHMHKARDLGISVAWAHPMLSLLRTGAWDIIEQWVYESPMILEGSLGKDCIEAHRKPALLPQVLRKGRELREQQGNWTADPWPYCMALAGDVDGALDAFQTSMEMDPTRGSRFWGSDPTYVAIRQNPRFVKILTENGLNTLYDVRGLPDRCRPAGAEGFVCE